MILTWVLHAVTHHVISETLFTDPQTVAWLYFLVSLMEDVLVEPLVPNVGTNTVVSGGLHERQYLALSR